MVLEDGAFGARVVHRDRSQWLVYAGPYRVVVTGTHFDVRWDARQHSFTLALHEGAVTVFGPSLDAGGKRVLPSETVRLGPHPGAEANGVPSRPLESAASSPRSRSRACQALVVSHQRTASEAIAGARTAGSRAGVMEIAGRCRQLRGRLRCCRKGRFREHLPAALRVAICFCSGNTARLAKKVAQAEEAFRAARARPGAAHQRAVAAFQLGRLAQDTRGDHARGATWFELYLSEAPDGPLAREAAGRVMEAHHRAGNGAAAPACGAEVSEPLSGRSLRVVGAEAPFAIAAGLGLGSALCGVDSRTWQRGSGGLTRSYSVVQLRPWCCADAATPFAEPTRAKCTTRTHELCNDPERLVHVASRSLSNPQGFQLSGKCHLPAKYAAFSPAVSSLREQGGALLLGMFTALVMVRFPPGVYEVENHCCNCDWDWPCGRTRLYGRGIHRVRRFGRVAARPGLLLELRIASQQGSASRGDGPGDRPLGPPQRISGKAATGAWS